MKFIIEKKTTLFYLLSAILLTTVLLIFYENNQKVIASNTILMHSQDVINKSDEVLIDALHIETGFRGYLISDDETFLQPFYNAEIKINTDLDQLKALTKENNSQQNRIDILKKSVNDRLIFTRKNINAQKQDLLNDSKRITIVERGKILTDEVKKSIATIKKEENRLEEIRKIENDKNAQFSKMLFLLLLVFLVALFVFVILIINNHKEKNSQLKTYNANQKSASKYALSLIEASRDPLFTISLDGKITDTNQASLRVTDISKVNLIGSDFITYFTEPEKAKKGYEEVFSKGFVIDYPLTIKDGKLTPVLFNGSVYKDENGNITGAVVVARDITEQKKVEKELLQSLKEVTDYKLALDASAIVDITDKNGTILFVNENYLKISKYSNNELIGGNHKKVNSGFHQKEFMGTLWNTISQGKIWQGELKNINKDGQHYWLNMTIVPFLNEKGLPYQYVAISIDITNQKALETQLIEARVFAELSTEIAEEEKRNAEAATLIAENAVKAKQQFLSNMSHEIRTPMNAIIGFTKVVLKTGLTEKQKEYLSAIKMSGDALIVLINDILDLAKVDAGKMTFEQIPFKLASSISAILHVFETKIQEKNLELVTEYDANIPKVLLGDSVRLHQIILNLVSNAIKFTSIGKITVSVHLFSQDELSATVEFAISDTGIGIDESKMETIFDNFQQATSGTSRLYGGTGLGLAIVKQLVVIQGGTISVKSKIHEGSTFSFMLKFLKTNSDTELETEKMEMKTDYKNIKVLIVEDMPLNQLLMKTLLDDFGFEYCLVENGKIAIEKLQENVYDIVLMDLQMPIMNGFEATKFIRNTLKLKLPIIALTADVTTVDLAKCKTVGMNDYIAKPVDEHLLYNKIIGLVKKTVIQKGTTEEEVVTKNDQKEAPTTKQTNLEYLNTRTKSNPKLMKEMISIFLQQTPPLLETMRQSILDKNWQLLAATTHKMIPSFAIMGMNPELENKARQIQEAAISENFTDETAHKVFQLETACNQACKELEIEFNLLKNT